MHFGPRSFSTTFNRLSNIFEWAFQSHPRYLDVFHFVDDFSFVDLRNSPICQNVIWTLQAYCNLPFAPIVPEKLRGLPRQSPF